MLEEDALGVLCARLQPYALACVRRRMGVRVRRWESAEGIAAQVALDVATQACTGAHRLGEEDLRARVRRTARWRLTDAARRHAHARGESALALQPPRPRELASDTSDTSVCGERVRWLHERIRALPAIQRDAVELCGLEGLSFVEAARRRGALPDTIRKRYGAALAQLRRAGAAFLRRMAASDR